MCVSRPLRCSYFTLFIEHCLFYLLTSNPTATTGLRPSTSPSSTLTSTATGCRLSFAQPLMLRSTRDIQMRMRSLQTTPALSWPSTATRNTFASLGPSSQGTIPAMPHPRPRPHSPLTAGENPAPGPGPAPTLDPAPLPGRTGRPPREAPAGPLA